jgi:isocitrate dehydrogenase (NAD+)
VTKYGGKYRAVMIPGDGIGPEMMFHIKESFRHVRAPVDFEEVPLNSKNVSESLIEQAVVAVKRNGACLKGNIETDHMNPTAFSVNLALRHRLDLFANVVRCKSLPNVKTRHGDIDIMIIRENTEGEYAALEHESVPGVVESLKIISRPRSIRIAEYAFARAKQDGRKKVTVVHKANIM